MGGLKFNNEGAYCVLSKICNPDQIEAYIKSCGQDSPNRKAYVATAGRTPAMVFAREAGARASGHKVTEVEFNE